MFDWIKKILFKDINDKIKIHIELDNGKYHEEFVDAEKYEDRIQFLQKTFKTGKFLEHTPFIWCLIGNIIDEHYSVTDKEIEFVTKHFLPNTKVHCFPTLLGDGYENIKVIGRHRKTNRFVCIAMPSKLITNWRLQKVYRPHIIKVMHSQKGWTDSEKDRETIIEMLKFLSNRTVKTD